MDNCEELRLAARNESLSLLEMERGKISTSAEALTKELSEKHGSRFSRKVAARELDVHPETVKRWCREGRLECVRYGPRSVKIEARTLARFITESRAA